MRCSLISAKSKQWIWDTSHAEFPEFSGDETVESLELSLVEAHMTEESSVVVDEDELSLGGESVGVFNSNVDAIGYFHFPGVNFTLVLFLRSTKHLGQTTCG